METMPAQKVNPFTALTGLVLVCWSLTSLCHSNGHIETMPTREINPFTALTRIRSQFLRTQWSTSNHQRVDTTTPQTAEPSGLAQLWPGFDPSFSGHNDEQSSASWQDYASDLSAIEAGKYIGGVVSWLIPHIPPITKSICTQMAAILVRHGP